MEKPRLIAVDDERPIVGFIRTVAESVGFETAGASSGAEFKSSWQDDYDVVVMDLMMPGTDGVELLRFLADAHCRASILLLSGFDRGVLRSAGELAQAHGLNVVGTLRKPISKDDLALHLMSAVRPVPRDTPTDNPEPTRRELQAGIGRRELVIAYQPKVDVSSRELESVEALVRWQHPRLGLLLPGSFIGLAERSGLIDDLTLVVLDLAVGQCADWRKAGLHTQVAVNISNLSLNRLDLPERIVARLKERELDPDQLMLEITESAVAAEEVKTLDILTRLRMRGVQLSIDDFGTAYSSMRQLNRVPFNEIKIDIQFVSRAVRDPKARAIVETTIHLGHKLGLTVVAEGVETEGTWDLLEELGCDQVQGHFISRPLAGEDLLQWNDGRT